MPQHTCGQIHPRWSAIPRQPVALLRHGTAPILTKFTVPKNGCRRSTVVTSARAARAPGGGGARYLAPADDLSGVVADTRGGCGGAIDGGGPRPAILTLGELDGAGICDGGTPREGTSGYGVHHVVFRI